VTASYAGRLTTIDITDPFHPTIVSSLQNASLLPLPVDVAVANGYAYVANETTTGGPFLVVDVRNPAAPSVAGSLSSAAALNGSYRVRVRNKFAYVAATYSAALAVMDISDPNNPRLAASFTSSSLLNRSVGVDLDPSAQYAVSTSPWLATETRNLYPPFPFQPGGPTMTGTFNVIGLDPVPIGVTISSAPASTTTATTAAFAFQMTDAVATPRCQIDGAPAGLCTTPTSQSYSSLALGSHTFTVQAFDAADRTASATYTWTITGQAPVNTQLPQVSGQVAVGNQLQASTGTWTGSAATYSYQWQRCDSGGANCQPIIGGATAASYTVAGADVGSTLRVTVTATNGAGQASADSAATAVVPQPQPPVNTQLPQVSGQATVGSQLQATSGSWSGSPAPTYAYQWQRCDSGGANCQPIGAATAASYAIVSADVGSTLLVTVTASNSAGQASANSAATAIVPQPAAGALAPTSPLLDDFNRANGPVGSNWTLIKSGSFATMNVASNAAVNSNSASQFAWNYWNAASFGPDAEAYATVATYAGNDVLRIGARVTVGSSYSGYFVAIAATGAWSIIRIDNGSAVTLATGPVDAVSSGDKIAIRIVGSVVTALHYTAAGGWKQVQSYNTAGDATRYTAAGRLALEFRYSTIDNFGGGGL
jgi:hypothetical protein